MKSTPGNDEPYQLNSQRIGQVLLDLLFFHQCVAYFFLMRLVRDCQIAGRELEHLQPAVAAFVRHTLKLHEADPVLLDPLRTYLQQKLGYKPSRFVLYYKERGRHKELLF